MLQNETVTSHHLSLGELRSELAAGAHLQLVDVRSADEFSSEHIPGAVNIPINEIESRLEDVSNSASVVLVCQSGDRANMACDLIAGRFAGLRVLDGGTSAWVSAGLPTVSSKSTRWALERQVRLGAGLLVLLSFVLAWTVSPLWLGLAAFVGLGLTFAGATNLCLMAGLLAKMPWNQSTAERCSKEPGLTN